MNRLGNKLFSSVLAVVAAASLAACGVGSHSALPAAVAPASTPAAPAGALQDVTLRITIPSPKTSSATRRPSYISSATKSIKAALSSPPTGFIPPPVLNVGTLPNATCPASGADFVCTMTIKIPPGSDSVTFTAFDAVNGSGNVLSQQISTLAVVAGQPNTFNVVFDANASTMAINATSGFCAGSFTVANSQSVGTVGTTPVTFSASYSDPATKTIVGPGLPLLNVNGHIDDNSGAGYTDPTTHLNVKVNQAAQSFTLMQTAGTGNAAVSVTATPPNGGDGLSFNKSLAFTFQSGPAPPSSFLADIEQIINGSGFVTGGVIRFWTVSLGASDTFTAYSTPTLANQSNDVDFPNDVLFDGNGDLMIANGGAGSPDFGNFSCVPAGAIATGANAATVLTTNMNDPVSLALGTDSSVGLLNGGNIPTYHLAEFVLSGTYSAASTTRDIAKSAYPTDGVHPNIVALPTTGANPAGSYAVALSDNTQAGTHILIKHPDGSQAEFAQDASDIFPYITYDPANNQIVAANNNSTSSHITFWSVASMTKVLDFVLENDGLGNSQAQALGPIASSADGHIAVAVTGASGFPELIIYDGTSNRFKVAATLDYGATTAPFGATFVYGGSLVSANVIHGMRWLSNTKLLVSLESQYQFAATASQGLYIYDITQTMAQSGFDGNGNPEPTPTVKQTGFKPISNRPLGAAYKP